MTRLLMMRICTPVIVVALLAASCGIESSDTTAPAATEAPVTTTTAAPPASTTTTTTTTTEPPATTTTVIMTGEPSQSVADAQRDGVVPEVAALPIELRVDPVFELRAAEGVWVVSRLHDDVWTLTDNGVLGDPGGQYVADFIDVPEYGEVLLLDGSSSAIIRAWPLPGLPPQRLILTPEAAYCAKQGDGGLPDSMVCRIDRATGEALVRVFPWVNDSGYPPPPDTTLPEYWTINEPVGLVLFQDLTGTEAAIAVSGQDGYALLDRTTLEIQTTNLDRESPAICSSTGLELELLTQGGLPDDVAAMRDAIFSAAMACDYETLGDLANEGEAPFEASFGGGDVPEFWMELEIRGNAVVAAMARHLNLAFAETDGFYLWPSAMTDLTSPYGDGLPDADYAALLELYSVGELEEMFDVLGGYVGWRHGIDGSGGWRFFLAGD